MQDLRLVGVHDDGEHLLLNGPENQIYRLRIDEALRVASRKNRTSAPKVNIVASEQKQFSPKAAQAKIRAGETAEAIAKSYNIDIEQVKRYERPILAERFHIVLLAKKVNIKDSEKILPEGYASIFKEHPLSLEAVVTHKLVTLNVAKKNSDWDAWRLQDGRWLIQIAFKIKEEEISLNQKAQWIYDLKTSHLTAHNLLAKEFTENEFSQKTKLISRNNQDNIFNIEENPKFKENETLNEEILELLSQRRGQHPSAYNKHDTLDKIISSEDTRETEIIETEFHNESEDNIQEDEISQKVPLLKIADLENNIESSSSVTENLKLQGDISTNTHEIEIITQNYLKTSSLGKKIAPSKTKISAAVPTTKDKQGKRPPVPTWDEIVFGTKK